MGMMRWIKRQAGFSEELSAYDAYCIEVQRARAQWQAAQNLFDSVSDPDLVDFAIYDLEASRRRYVYMLRKSEELARAVNQAKCSAVGMDAPTAS